MHIAQRVTHRPVAVTMFYLGVLLLGVISLSRLPVDLLPDLAYPKLTVQTPFREAPPEEVERLITAPLEASLSTIAGLRRLSSVSSEGMSRITLEFTWGRDMDFAALHVREKLDALGRLPEGAEEPAVIRLDPASQAFMGLSVTGGNLAPLADLSRNVIKRRMEQLEGVAQARVTGGPKREIHIDLRPERMDPLGLSVAQVASAIDQANRDLPGGTLLRGRYRFSLRTLGAFQSPEEIGQVVVKRGAGGHRVLLSEIADIDNGFQEPESITQYNGRLSVGVLLYKESGANTVRVAGAVQTVLRELEKEYPQLTLTVAFNQAGFISQAISNLLWAIALGGVLAFLVLFVFLHDARHPMAVGVAIPLAIIATFTLMHFSGVTLNLMSLGGLALGVGMLVDASIVVLENIFRHHEEGATLQEAAVSGTSQVAMAVTASTFTTMAVFLPVLYVKGVAGQLFRDQALTVTFSLLASLAVSLTLLPVMAARFKKPGILTSDALFLEEQRQRQSRQQHKFWRWLSWPFKKITRAVNHVILGGLRQIADALGALSRFLRRWLSASMQPLFDRLDRILAVVMRHYEHLLEKALDHRAATMVILLAILLSTAAVGLSLPRELLPSVDQGEFTVALRLPPGASLEAVSEAATRLETLTLAHEGVADVFTQMGRMHGDNTGASGLNRAHLHVRLHRGERTAAVLKTLRPQWSNMAGEITVSDAHSLLGQLLGQQSGDVEIRLYGENVEACRALADSLPVLLAGTGLVDFKSASALARPEIRLSIDRETAGRYGLSVWQIAAFLRDRVAGSTASQFKAFNEKIDILVRPAHAMHTPLKALLDVCIPAGENRVPLRALVSAQPGRGTTAIHRENQNTLLRVTARVQSRGLGQAVQAAEHALAKRSRPGLRLEIGGAREEMAESYQSLTLAALLAAALVFMIMAAQFESLRLPLVILFSVPMAAIGTVWLLFLTGQSLNVIALIGVVVLVGIAVNDAIVKVDFINQSRRGGLPLRQALMEAGRKRFRPIIMTSATTILGLLPLAIGLGQGAELQRPLALAVIGGLITSTALTLICIPVIYTLLEGKGE